MPINCALLLFPQEYFYPRYQGKLKLLPWLHCQTGAVSALCWADPISTLPLGGGRCEVRAVGSTRVQNLSVRFFVFCLFILSFYPKLPEPQTNTAVFRYLLWFQALPTWGSMIDWMPSDFLVSGLLRLLRNPSSQTICSCVACFINICSIIS